MLDIAFGMISNNPLGEKRDLLLCLKLACCMQTSDVVRCSPHKPILSGHVFLHMRLHHDQHCLLANMHKLIKHPLLLKDCGRKATDCIMLHWSMQDGSPHSKQARHRCPVHH